MQEDSLKKRYAIKLIANLLTSIINAIIITIIPRELGPIAYGQFIYLQRFFQQLLSFLDMGVSIAFFTKLSAKHDRKELITFYFIYLFSILTIIYCLIIFIDIFNFTDIILPNIDIQYVYIGFFYVFLSWVTQILIKISDAYAITASVEVIRILHKIGSFCLLIVFIFMVNFNLHLYFVYLNSMFGLYILILVWFFFRKGIFTLIVLNIKLKYSSLIKEFIIYSRPLVVYSIINLVVGIFDIWLLQYSAGSEQVGFYGLAYAISTLSFIFIISGMPLITREFSKLFGQKNINGMHDIFMKYLPIFYNIAVYFSIFVSFQSENLLYIFAGEEYSDAYSIMVLLALYPIYQTYGQFNGAMFSSTGRTYLYKKIALLTQPFGVLLSIIFIYFFELGAVGLGIKTLVILFIGTHIRLYYNSKFLNYKMSYFIKNQILSLLIFTVLAFVSTFIMNFSSVFMNFIFSGILYTIVAIIMLVKFPNLFFINQFTLFRNYIKLRGRF